MHEEEAPLDGSEQVDKLEWFWDENYGQMLAMAIPMASPPEKRARTEEEAPEPQGKTKGKNTAVAAGSIRATPAARLTNLPT